MTHATERAQPIMVIPMRKPAAWVLRGDPRTVERARRARLPLHRED